MGDIAVNHGAYVLRDLMRNAPLSPDGEEEHNVYITCVDAWGEFVLLLLSLYSFVPSIPASSLLSNSPS
jgi:hypothetical protein